MNKVDAFVRKHLTDTSPAQYGRFFWRRFGGEVQLHARLGSLDSGEPVFEARKPQHGRYTEHINSATVWALLRVKDGEVTLFDFGDFTLPIDDARDDLERIKGFTIRGRKIDGDDVEALIALVSGVEVATSLRDAMAQPNGLSSPPPSLGTLELDTSHEGDVVNFSIRNRVDDETTEPFGSGELTSAGKLSMLFADSWHSIEIKSREEIAELEKRLDGFWFAEGRKLTPADCSEFSKVLSRIYDAGLEAGLVTVEEAKAVAQGEKGAAAP
jgi:hypothetical protein